jgi:hypothetical protein
MYLLKACGNETEIPWAATEVQASLRPGASLVEILQEEPALKGVPMFYLLGFQDPADNPVLPSVIRNR